MDRLTRRTRVRRLVVHGAVAFLIMSFTAIVITTQVRNRATFANVELYEDVIDRWGAPIEQPSPTVRYVATGAVFTELASLPLTSQTITMDATMNYRKRGLV